MQSPAFRRMHAWLALTAMLLLALMPAFGRLTGHAGQYASAPGMHGGRSPLHATAMPRPMPAALAGIDHGNDPGTPHPTHANEDCGYCLLNPTAPPAAPVLAGDAPAAGGMPWSDGHAQVIAHPAPSPSLGSRGPPAA